MTRQTRSARIAPRHLRILLVIGSLGLAAFDTSTRLPLHTRLAAQTVSPLSSTIDAILGDAELARGTWGVAIQSLDRQETLYERNADKLMLPASTLKIVTLAVVAERLGWDHSFATRLYRTGEIDGAVLRGDLVIVGSGDPSVDDWDGIASHHFRTWAHTLREMGIQTVAGRVIGDDNVFDDDDLGNGWAWDDMAASYSAGVSGLQFNENTAQLIVSPSAIGASPTIQVRPPTAALTVVNRARTAVAGPPLQIRPAPRSTTLEVIGTLAPATPSVVRNVSVANPTRYFAEAVRASLVGEGIAVEGPAIDVDDLVDAAPMAEARLVGEFRSPPLRSLATTMMHFSQNLFAESLLKTLSATTTAPGSFAGGRAVITEQLVTWGLPAADMVIADGSGLSRYNLITPRAQAAVLAAVHASDRLREPFMETLPLAGKSGTLERRMAGTLAMANARAKTGSFSNARALAGFVRTQDREQLAFSIIANNYNVPPSTVDQVTDAIVVALAGFKR